MKQHRFVFVAVLSLLAACTNYQEADVPDALRVDVTELSFSSGSATRSVTVQSGTKWMVNDKPDWVSVPSISSMGGFQWGITFAVSENPEYDREGVISINSGSGSATIAVSQQGKKGKYVAVESVSVSPATLTMTEGETEKLSAVVTPSNASVKTVTWKSLNTAAATVDDDGNVTAVAEGMVTIRVTTDDGGKTADCVVTVKAKTVPVTGVSLDQTTMTLTEGDTSTLTATVAPANATNKDVTWSSSNTNVATVSASGVVTAKAAGSATITVTTVDGSKKATCSVTVNAKVIPVTGVSLDQTTMTLTEGDTSTLTATVSPANATNKDVTWSSSNTNVATVSASGVVTAKAAGSATITVTTVDGSKKATCSVTINAKVISVTGVSLDQTTMTLTEGDTSTLTATVSPANATNKDVTWSSSNTNVATVSASGVVTAKAAGSATITVTTVDGSKKATCSVTVNAKVISVTGVSLDKTSLTLEPGQTETLTATVAPANATNKNVSWSSSNTSVATVSTSGVVTAKTVGAATITVTTVDGSKKATCSVTVKASVVHVTGVSLDKASLDLEEGETYTLTATVTPSNATDKSVTWVSNNTDVATVSSSGVVTAVAAGTAAITVKTNDEAKIATCVVIVSKKVIAVTGVTLNYTSLTLTEGDTSTLTATVSPANATNKSVTWSSSNTAVATVSSSGVVTAKKAGTATITVTTVDGNKKATCSVTVQAAVVPVTGVTLNYTSLTLTEGDTSTLTATVSPANATNKSVTWSSSNTAVATVSSSGVVTAKKTGTATITVTTVDGNKKATCSVTVQAAVVPVTGLSLNYTGGSEGMVYDCFSFFPQTLNRKDSSEEVQIRKNNASEEYVNKSIVAQYRTEPADADLSFLEVGSSSGLSFIVKEGTASSSFSAIPSFVSFEDGILSVEVRFSGSPGIENPLPQIALQVEREDGGIVTSDYSTVRSEDMGHLAIAFYNQIANNWLGVNDAHLRRASLGISQVDDKAFISEYAAWSTGACDLSLLYNSSLDLRTLIAAHWVTENGDDSDRLPVELTAYEMYLLGLSWEFSVVSNYRVWFSGSMQDASNFVVLSGGVLQPKSYPDPPIGCTPIIRVALKHGNDVVEYAYIKFDITGNNP